MRLTSIQLAGFKSFVEPTRLHFPGDRTAIVGPNGCGKSNVIDAVRWVMGESSAKQLRGDGMTDVIFNGSSSRRAQGAASVELIFDNTDSRITGQYAAVTSLAIKRRLSRDGDNQFFINGEKCRRRDVTDLFSGTGLGPRSYAIIEQGTIARLIDAKPEDLRSFIEEAAGITKYKERRRETALRIEHSRENLARIHDITSEVQNNINKLAAQAEAAERFRTLKQRIRNHLAQQKALQWRDLQTALEETEGLVQQLGLQLQQIQLELAQSQVQQEAQAEQQASCLAAQDSAHQQVLQINQAISEHLTKTAHLQAQQTLWRQQEREVCSEAEELANMLCELKETAQARAIRLAQLQQNLDLKSAELCEQRLASLRAQAQQKTLTEELINTQSELQASANLQQLLASQQQALLAQVDSAEAQLLERQKNLLHIQASCPDTGPVLTEDQFGQEQASFAASADELAQVLVQLERNQNHLAEAGRQRDYWAGRLGRDLPPPASDAALTDINAKDWQPLAGAWGDTWAAAEAWLHPWISARPWSGSWEEASEQLAAPAFLVKPDTNTQDVVRWLDSWQPAADRQVALTGLKAAPEAIFYTPLGEVFARDWMYLPAPGASRFDLNQCLAKLANLDQEVLSLTEQSNKLQHQKVALELVCHQQQQNRLRGELMREYHQSALITAQSESEQVQNQLHRLSQELASSRLQAEEHANRQLILDAQLVSVQAKLTANSELLSACELDEQTLVAVLEQVRSALQQEQADMNAAEPLLQRLAEQQLRLQAKLAEITQLIAAATQVDEPLTTLRQQLNQAEKHLQTLKNQYSAGEKALKNLLGSDKNLRLRQEQLRVEQETAKLAAQVHLTEQHSLLNDAFDINAALAMLPAQTVAEQLEVALNADKTELELLGPVNLAALEEYEQARQRAEYLLQQQTDLHQALECLENAVKQIDRETRQRFKQTFDAANLGLQELFPQVFAGGSAYLELVGDDLLNAGVAIMARPPGKKNSTIHLLSGGEKALTALALVFALFRLNPAPFCLLDEVDAPLDDANVGRFARLVEAMAQQVQFIFITHNKIAMEMAEHLLGVTMQEPGVSRVVSVDIAQAAQLAAD